MLGVLRVGSITIGNKQIINQHVYEQGASMCTQEASLSICGQAVGQMRCSGHAPAALLLRNRIPHGLGHVVSGAGGWIPALPISLSRLPSPALLESTFFQHSPLHLPCPASPPAPGTYFSVFWDRLV